MPLRTAPPVQEQEEAAIQHQHSIAPQSIVLAVGVLLGSIVLLLLVQAILGPLLLIITGIIIAEALRPAVEFLNRRGIPRGIAVLLVYLLLGAVTFFILSYLLGPLIRDANTLRTNLPGYITQAQQELTRLQTSLRDSQQLLNPLRDQLNGLLNGTVHMVLVLPQQLFTGFIALLFLALLALFWLTATRQMTQLIFSITPRHWHATLREVFVEESRVLGGWVRGVLVNMLLLGSLTAGVLLLFHVRYALLLGVLAAITQIIPYVGAWIAGVPAVALAYLDGGPTTAAEVAVVYVVLQQVAGVVFVPLVMHSTVRLHPLITTFALLLGATLLGLAGAVLAVPIAAALQVPISLLIIPALQGRAQRLDKAREMRHPPPPTR